MNYQPDEIWDAATWAAMDEAVAEAVKRVGVARRVFRTERVMAADGTAPSWMSGAAMQTRDADKRLFIPEGDAHPFVEISVGFTLTGAQVEDEGSLHIGMTLARTAATQLAQAEDALVLMGTTERGKDKLTKVAPSAIVTGQGHLAERDGVAFDAGEDGKRVPDGSQEMVRLELPENAGGDEQPTPATGLLNGVANVASNLSARGWPAPYALILGSKLYADSSSQLVAGSTETPADRLASQARLILVSGALDATHGVVVSLAGDATTIYIARDAPAAFVSEELDDEGVYYHFRVFERIQYAVRDRGSIGLLLPPTEPGAAPDPGGS